MSRSRASVRSNGFFTFVVRSDVMLGSISTLGVRVVSKCDTDEPALERVGRKQAGEAGRGALTRLQRVQADAHQRGRRVRAELRAQRLGDAEDWES